MSEEKTKITKKNEDSLDAIEPKEEEFSSEDFDSLPPEAKKHVSRMVSMFMSSGPAPHPFLSKMNTDQVGKVIDNIEKESIRDHQNRMASRRWDFAYLLAILVFILLIAAGCIWKDKFEYIAPIITAIIGAVGGYGLGVSRKESKD